jgi:hypothetical protein
MGDNDQDLIDDTGKAPVDCYKTYGPKFVDCETESGWDCCFIGTAEDLNSPTDPVASNNDPIDCYKTYGPSFVDPLKDYDKPVSMPANSGSENNHQVVSDDQCALNFGVRWYDCQRGYGLDCCLIDDVDQKDQTLWTHEWTENTVEDGCAQVWGPGYYDCQRGYGLDCCVVDNGHLPTHDGEMHKQSEMNKSAVVGRDDTSLHVLRWLVLIAMMAFVVITLVGRAYGGGNNNKNRRFLPRSGENPFSAIPEDDDEDGDSDIELKPLI